MANNSHSIDLELSSSQYLSITDAAQTGLDITGDITIEAWIKLEQLPSTAGSHFRIVAKWLVSKFAYLFSIRYMTTADGFEFAWSDNGDFSTGHRGLVKNDVSVFTAADVGKWRHVAVTVDVSAGAAGVKFYKDGSEQTSKTTSFDEITSIANTSADFTIGAEVTPASYFDGLIDEVRVWSDIRTQDEIKDNMFAELVGNEANLVGYWKLNNSLLDETANNNDLTNNNSAVFSSADRPFGYLKSIGDQDIASVKTIGGKTNGNTKTVGGTK